jgi:hypothetical protein
LFGQKRNLQDYVDKETARFVIRASDMYVDTAALSHTASAQSVLGVTTRVATLPKADKKVESARAALQSALTQGDRRKARGAKRKLKETIRYQRAWKNRKIASSINKNMRDPERCTKESGDYAHRRATEG